MVVSNPYLAYWLSMSVLLQDFEPDLMSEEEQVESHKGNLNFPTHISFLIGRLGLSIHEGKKQHIRYITTNGGVGVYGRKERGDGGREKEVRN